MTFLFRTLIIGVLSLGTLQGMAQLPNVDIKLADNGSNQLEVRIRPDAYFDGLFSSVVFTIRWDAASGANLGAISQPLPADDYINITRSGSEVDDMGYRYQVFAGFGFVPLTDIPTTWDGGVEYVVMTIPVQNGSSVFEIVNDTWTAANNADYFVSLNGQDKTGIIYQLSTGVAMSGAVVNDLTVTPNPSEGPVVVTFSVPTPQTVEIEVLNSLGQRVHNERLPAFSGTYRGTIDLAQQGSGVYMMNLRTDRGVTTERIVIK